MDQSDFEEAASSDDDYSPGSLIIDTEGGGEGGHCHGYLLCVVTLLCL